MWPSTTINTCPIAFFCQSKIKTLPNSKKTQNLHKAFKLCQNSEILPNLVTLFLPSKVFILFFIVPKVPKVLEKLKLAREREKESGSLNWCRWSSNASNVAKWEKLIGKRFQKFHHLNEKKKERGVCGRIISGPFNWVWQDLAKFRHLWNNKNVFGHCLKVHLVLG